MNFKIQIVLAVAAAVSCSFLQAPSDQFQLTFNSTFLSGSEKLSKPIIIPNMTKFSKHPPSSKIEAYETYGTKVNEVVLKKILQPEESLQEFTIRKNPSEEKPKSTENHLKFSSRYSTKHGAYENLSREKKESEETPEGGNKRDAENELESTEIPNSMEKNKSEDETPKRDEDSTAEKQESFSDCSEDSESSEEEKETPRGFSASEESKEVGPTPSETHSDLPGSTSFRKYSDEDFESYETTSATSEETGISGEKDGEEVEGKRSVEDYHNSGSKNYHSIQTPLNQIKYRGPHSFKNNVKSDDILTRLVNPANRHPISHGWPYSRPQIKEELEKLNEISESNESYEKYADEGLKEEGKTKPSQLGLEVAVEKDEYKFDRNRKYNYVDERNRRKEQQKSLAAEEEKDDRTGLLFQNLKQYQVDEQEPRHKANIETPSHFRFSEGLLTTKGPVSSPPKKIVKFEPGTNRKPKKLNVSNEMVPDFQNHQFLGPISFNQNLEPRKMFTSAKPFVESQRVPVQNIFSKGLIEIEKLDQDNLNEQKFHKAVTKPETEDTQSFNHLKESDEIYNAIIANIQSVFGLRTQPLKSGTGSRRESLPEVNSDESQSLTWFLPLMKRKNSTGRLQEVSSKGSSR